MRRALFPTSSEDFPPLSQIPPKGLFLSGNTPSSSGLGIDALSPHVGERSAINPQTRGASNDPNFDSTLVLFPAGRLPSPLGSGQTGPMEIDSIHVCTNLLTEGQNVPNLRSVHPCPLLVFPPFPSPGSTPEPNQTRNGTRYQISLRQMWTLLMTRC